MNRRPLLTLMRGAKPFVDPSSYSPVFWVSADTITGKNDGDTMSAWNDLSGLGHNLGESTAGYRPTYKTNIINSLPVVRFDETDDGMKALFVNAKPSTVFAVVKVVTFVNAKAIWDGGTDPNGLKFGSGTSSGNFVLHNSSDINIPQLLADFCVVSIVYNATTATIRVNGVQVWTGSHTLANNSAGITLGNSPYYVFGGANSPSDGEDFAEFIMYGSALASSKITNVENYLSEKYNINF